MAGKGKPKTGGRKKGTPNKRSEQAMAIAQKHRFCPIKTQIELYRLSMKEFTASKKRVERALKSPNLMSFTDNSHKYLDVAAKCVGDVSKYLYPQLKSVELSGDDANPLFLPISREDVLKAINLDPFLKRNAGEGLENENTRGEGGGDSGEEPRD